MKWDNDYKKLAELDQRFEFILETYGLPDENNKKNDFESLVQIILGQQVSTSSAKSHFDKLKQRLKQITPINLLELSDQELKEYYITKHVTIFNNTILLFLKNRFSFSINPFKI